MSATSEETHRAPRPNRTPARIEEIQGVVIEAVFPDKLPEINHAIKVQRPEAARAEEDEDIAAARTSTWSARSSSTSAMTASARSPWTPPTGSPAAPR